MYDVVIIHGSFGSPYENWFPWLYKKLTDEGKNVLVPHFPTPNGQNLDNWMEVMNSYNHLIGKNTVFIAHSIAPAFVVDYLVNNQKKVKGLIAVAPFYGLISIKEFDDVNWTFFIDTLNLRDVKKYTSYVYCLYSDNDPYIPIELSEIFARETSASFMIMQKGKHLNADSGYLEFNQIVEVLNSK